jgi:hypothetical protein
MANKQPRKHKGGPFARANGAIGRDGQYAIFPDERTGMGALKQLLRTPYYRSMLVREALACHACNLNGSTETRARAIQYKLDPGASLDSLNDQQLGRLIHAITSISLSR